MMLGYWLNLSIAPDIQHRTWRLPSSTEVNAKKNTPLEYEEPTDLMGFPLAGESLQIARPLLHCILIFILVNHFVSVDVYTRKTFPNRNTEDVYTRFAALF